MTKFRLIFSLILIMCGLAWTGSAEAQTGLLTNSSFEEPYTNGIAGNWYTWYEERNMNADCNTTAVMRRPTWSAEIVGGNGGQLHFDGTRSQHISSNFATWRGGMFQSVPATPGSVYRFGVWSLGRAGNDAYPAPSDRSVNMSVRVGIDPNGGSDWWSNEIIWGPRISPHDFWQEAAVSVQATGQAVSVFVDANFAGAGNCRRHLDMWFDTASLTTVLAAPTLPLVRVTDNASPLVTPLPTGPWPTETPTPGGVVDTPIPPATRAAG